MDKHLSISKSQLLVAICLAHSGYRRAGIGFKEGINILDHNELNDAQLAALDADPRLKLEVRQADDPELNDLPKPDVVSAPGRVDTADGTETLTGTIGGGADGDGKVTALEDMTVAELRELAADLDISGARSMKKAALVAAIGATDVQVPAEAAE